MKRVKKSKSKNKTSRYLIFSLLGLLVLALPVTMYVISQHQNNTSLASSNFTATSGRPYADNSPFNDPIGTSVELDPNSASMVSALNASTPISDTVQFGTPIFFADANTPKYTINCTETWGTCALERQQVPIPDGAQGSSGSDGQMVIVDLAARKSYDFWQYKNDHANTSWGAVISIDGPGYDNGGNSAVGAGTSRLVGITRTYEIAQGNIDHALVFSTSACGTETRAPAQKTDGHVSGASSVPEGARVQLDPSVDCASLSGAGSGEIAICKAMQKYGAYSIDCGGASMALQFENPIGKTDPYGAAGMTDYGKLSHIPWDKMRVLKAWNSYTPATSQPTTGASAAPTVAVVTPSFAPIGDCDANGNCPSTSPTTGEITTAPTEEVPSIDEQITVTSSPDETEPTTSPCETTAATSSSGSTVSVQHHRHHSDGGGFQGLWQMLIDLLNKLLALLGGNGTTIPSPTEPCVSPTPTTAADETPTITQ